MLSPVKFHWMLFFSKKKINSGACLFVVVVVIFFNSGNYRNKNCYWKEYWAYSREEWASFEFFKIFKSFGHLNFHLENLPSKFSKCFMKWLYNFYACKGYLILALMFLKLFVIINLSVSPSYLHCVHNQCCIWGIWA